MKYYFLALGTLVFVCVGCHALGDGQHTFDNGEHYAPPAAMMQRPGPMVDGPGPGVLAPLAPPPQRVFAANTTQVRFVGPVGMHIGWLVPGGYAENQVMGGGRYDFLQGATYRLKLSDIPGAGREKLVLYPTLQVYPTHPSTDAYLSHNSVPVEVTDEDLDQVASNNFVTKVIYLPAARYQELAIAGVETLVSTKLDPGVNPVEEASRRGTILVVLRMGNMDLEMPGRGQAAAAAGINTVSYDGADGEKNQHVPPMPISSMAPGVFGVPGATIMGTPGAPGMPANSLVTGMPGAPSWGMPITATPIGLPGPPHLPYGGPAGLKSHTVRNKTKIDLPDPVDHVLIDVKHEPGISLPEPVKYIQYSESHPTYSPNEVSYPGQQ